MSKFNKKKKQLYSYSKKINSYPKTNLRIFTIGYGGRYEDHYWSILKSLQKNHITAVVDVRASPFCSFDNRLNKKQLNDYLYNDKIEYFHYPELGNIFRDVENGEKSYEKLYQMSGNLLTKRLRELVKRKWEKGKTFVTLLCACAEVKYCHRNVISGFLKVEHSYEVTNIKPTRYK